MRISYSSKNVKSTKCAKVLVVDDDASFRGLIRRIFEDDSYRVMDAATARQAWGLLLEESIDIVILDLVLQKETDGMDLLKRLRQDPKLKDIPVVTVTCHLGNEWLARSIKLGANDCFRKGFDQGIFKCKVEQFISQRRAEMKSNRGHGAGRRARKTGTEGVVLVAVDGEKRLRLTRQRLRAAGYEVISTLNTARIVALALKHRPDCIVLDCDDGGCDAAEVCADIQSHTLIRPTPVIVQSLRPAMKLKVLRGGADHFVPKSDDPEELLVAVHICQRRREWSAQILRKGDIMLDPRGRTVYLDNAPVATLPEDRFRLLYLLVQSSPNPVSRQDICRRVLRRPELPEKSRAVDALASRLRRDIKEPLRDRIISRRNFGFSYSLDSSG